jgi:ribosome biogenesis GTPase
MSQSDRSPQVSCDRTSLSPSSAESTELWWGTVVAGQANFYWVKLDRVEQSQANGAQANQSQTSLLCTRRARLKKLGQQVMVGDRVGVEEPDWTDKRGAIAAIAPRHSQMDRPPIANADQVLLVFALTDPPLDPHQLSHFLVKAESTGLRVLLGLNKQDLVTPALKAEWQDRLETWGYYPQCFSVLAQTGLEDLALRLQGQITVVSGPSGVGKSSLINALVPTLDLRTGEVSGKLGRGRHTTRHVELFELPTGGLLADTPGFNQPDITSSPTNLAQCFPEIQQRLAADSCRFSDCLHRDEPGCVVGTDWERYPLYLELLADAIAQQQALSDRPTEEAATKTKITEAGRQEEPKLLARRYRRHSRRSQHQALQDLCDEITDSRGAIADLDDLDGYET